MKKRLIAIATTLGIADGGVFVPHRYAASLRPPATYKALEPVFAAAEPAMAEVLSAIDRFAEIVDRFSGAKPPMPRWGQDWFPGLDGAAAYAIVRAGRPRRILEVGSGHSTRFMAQAVADGGLETEIHCVDPAPRADISALNVRLRRRTLQETALGTLPELEPGDVLFIDSSHLALPGSDVDLLFSEIVPALAPGVLVHVHDVLLPDGYPRAWDWRAYSEHQVVSAWLASGGLEPLFSSHYTRTRLADRVAQSAAARIPVSAGAHETSLWCVKRSPQRVAGAQIGAGA
ncbi:class I SAM-dependent methyltransferase [Thalassobaculum sp. OXR-137]|uniref:class I SAM-dependent methyltransferase n=1 Tax=Thalassobaculum sp. OXR-137 TaxID=3100173 RepID=UPI002AC8D722|nr:class I SAM-dependent methyltransferase [Thalassobaculum sp. OXR-137]WPZ35461.1 class I SAM-dependent methyltransferase [Thalassobaculum sp. OXR-137]